MGWYLRSSDQTSDRLTDDQIRQAICCYFRQDQCRNLTTRGCLPAWQRLDQAVLFALLLSLSGYLFGNLAFEWLFGSRQFFSGICVWGLIWLLSFVLQCIGWSSVWQVAYHKRYRFRPLWHRGIKILSICAFLLSIGLSFAAMVDDFRYLPLWSQTINNQTRFSLNADKTVLTLRGTIGKNSAAHLMGILKEYPSVDAIELDMSGGWIDEARKMHQIIQQSSLKTRVIHECSSACTIVFMAGTIREVDSGGKIGFHRYHYVGQENIEEIDMLEKAYLVSLGLPAGFVTRALGSEHVWYPSANELYQANVTTEQAIKK